MKRILLASAMASVAFSAQAADLGSARMPIAAEVVSGFSWTGIYAGLHAGYGFSNTSISVPGTFGFSGIGANGWLVGGKIGADYQFAQRWVVGLLAEGNLQGIDTTISIGGGGGGGQIKISGDRRWSVRARLGYLVTPETMLYVTGGWSQGHVGFSITGGGGLGGLGAGLTTSGWQVGGGIETRIAGNWFAHAEYVHTFSNSIGQFAPLVVKPSSGTARVGLSYRFGLAGAGGVYPAFAAPARRDWSGFFAGAQLGYGFANTTLSVPNTFSFRGIGSQGLTGGLIGGYDHQFAGTNIVAGVEADVSLSDIRTTLNIAGFTASVGSDWNVGLRGRLGYVLGGSVMPYVSAGYGWSHLRAPALLGGLFTGTAGGFQVGAGIETMITANLAVRAEYIHQFNSSRDLVPGLLTYRTDTGRARVGLTWKFGGEDLPVVARY